MQYGYFKGKKVAECQDSQTGLMNKFKKQGLVDEWRDAKQQPAAGIEIKDDALTANMAARAEAERRAAEQAEADRVAAEKAEAERREAGQAQKQKERNGNKGKF
jgi:hypothetical protein